MLERRILTNAVLNALKFTGHPVGDGYAPEGDYGWTNTPESPGSSFIPYLVLVPTAVSDISGSLAMPDFDMWVPYTVSGFGSTREQCEWIMDDSRELIESIEGRTFEGKSSRWKISYVDAKSIGGIVRGGPEDSPVFGQTDTFILFVSEEII